MQNMEMKIQNGNKKIQSGNIKIENATGYFFHATIPNQRIRIYEYVLPPVIEFASH